MLRGIPVLLLAVTLTSCEATVGTMPDSGVQDAGGDGGPAPDAGADGGTDAGSDAGTGTDAGTDAGADAGGDAGGDGGTDAGADVGPAHRAGSYTTAALDFPIIATGVREHSVTYDTANGGGYVVTLADASGPNGFRLKAVNVRIAQPTPITGAALSLDDPIAGEHYSGPNSVASGADATGGLLLAVLQGYRSTGGVYSNWIYGQFLRAFPDGRLEKVGTNFLISSASGNEQKPCVGWDAAAGTFLVGYSSSREFPIRGDGWVLFARTVSTTGALGPELRVGEQEPGQVNCALSSGGGRFLLAWHDYLATGGNNFDTAYRRRMVGLGMSLGPVIPAVRVGMVSPDPPALAYNSRRDEWIHAYALGRAIRVAIYRPDGSARVTDRLAVNPTEGAGVPWVGYSRVTNSYLLSWHAWTSNDAYAHELDPDGNPVGPELRLNSVSPPNGTYLTPIGASTRSGEYLVVMMKDFTRLNGTVFQSTAVVP